MPDILFLIHISNFIGEETGEGARKFFGLLNRKWRILMHSGYTATGLQ